MTQKHIHGWVIAVLRYKPSVLMFVDINKAPKLSALCRNMGIYGRYKRVVTGENIRVSSYWPLLYHCKLCASFRDHWWIRTGVTARKCPNWGICFPSLTLSIDFGMDITPVNGNYSENVMIRWEEQCEKGVTGGRTDLTIHRVAWLQLQKLRVASLSMDILKKKTAEVIDTVP